MDNQEINEAVARALHGDDWRMWSAEDYCGSIEAAWEIVETLRKRFDYVELIVSGTWSCGARNGTQWAAWESAETAPMAIALAFLKL